MKNLVIGLFAFTAVAVFGAPKAAKKATNVKAPAAAVAPVPAPAPAPAEQPQAAAVTTETIAAPVSQAAVTGTVDLRPSYGSKLGELHSENYADIGYKFNDRFHVIYEQDFNTLGYKAPSWVGNSNLTLGNGMVRFKANNLLESSDKVFSLSYELRPYIPISTSDRDKGMVTWVRNYAKLAAKVSNSVTLSLYEVVIPKVYSRDGNGSSANAAFENRVYLLADWNMTEKWSLSANLILNSTKYRDYAADTTNSGKWSQFLWTYPELDYALTPNYTLGLSYYSDNLAKPDFSGLDVGTGLENGVTQLVFRATL